MDDVVINLVPTGDDIEVTELICNVSDRSLQQAGNIYRISAWVY
jgi:hypothetical protein